MNRQRAIAEYRREQALRLHSEGWTNSIIAGTIGITVTRVGQILKDAGLGRNPPLEAGIKAEREAECRRLYQEERMKPGQIAVRLGMTASWVSDILVNLRGSCVICGKRLQRAGAEVCSECSMKAWHARMKAEGRCQWCGKPVAPGEKWVCPLHVGPRESAQRKAAEKRLSRNIEAGLCVVCGKQEARPRLLTCAPCAAKRNTRVSSSRRAVTRALYGLRRSSGLITTVEARTVLGVRWGTQVWALINSGQLHAVERTRRRTWLRRAEVEALALWRKRNIPHKPVAPTIPLDTVVGNLVESQESSTLSRCPPHHWLLSQNGLTQVCLKCHAEGDVPPIEWRHGTVMGRQAASSSR